MKLKSFYLSTIFFCLSCVLVLNSCTDDLDELTTEIPNESEQTNEGGSTVDLSLYSPEQSTVVTSVTALISDKNGNAIEGAIVRLGEYEYLTNENGRFLATDITLNAEGSTYTVYKEGFFRGVRRFYPQENSLHQSSVQMIEKTEIGTFDSESGGTLSNADNLSLSFSPNSIVDKDGKLVEGAVSVSAYWIDPSQTVVNEQLPGSLVGLNTNIEEVALVSYSMAAIELSANGEEVNIAPGEKAVIEFPIPESLETSAPEEITLWSLEEDLGIWIEEGTATKQGTRYIAEVAHFSFWNCDAYFPLVNVTGIVQDPKGSPIIGATVSASLANSSNSGSEITDSFGRFNGYIPANQVVTLEVMFDDCDVLSFEIGPLTSDTNLGSIILYNIDSVNLTGTVLGCDGTAVSNSFVEVETSSSTFIFETEDNGTFDIAYPTCINSEISVSALDYSTLTQGSAVNLLASQHVDFGNLVACGEELENFISISYQELTTVSSDVSFLLEGDVFETNLIWITIGTLSDAAFSLKFVGYDLSLNSITNVDTFLNDYIVTSSYENNLTCGHGPCEETYGAPYIYCLTECNDFTATLNEYNLNVGYPELDQYTANPGSVIAGEVSGTTPNGEELHVKFRVTVE